MKYKCYSSSNCTKINYLFNYEYYLEIILFGKIKLFSLFIYLYYKFKRTFINLHLVLIDTPGTNNSETESHQNTTYSLIDSNDAVKPVILYILNSEQLRTNDDKKLLNDMANVMSEGGRADSERFIFILNKADAFNPEDNEDLQSVLERCTKYLEECGIKNPRIFPCSAQFALVIRKKMAGYELTDDEDDDFEKALKTVTKNRIPKMFSQWAPLRKELKEQMETELNLAKQKNDIEKQALIYSGVPAIELAINDYLLKYAMPIKIRDENNRTIYQETRLYAKWIKEE